MSDNNFVNGLFVLAQKITTADARFKLADPEAGYILEFSDTMLGRGSRSYNLIANVEGNPTALIEVLKEVVLPLKDKAPLAFAAGIAFMKEKAPLFHRWKNIRGEVFEEPEGPQQWIQTLDRLSL